MARLSLALVLIPLVCLQANAQAIVVEGESYVASHNEGGDPISVVGCAAASGGQAVEGFDFPGDWIEVVLGIAENGAFTDRLRSGGDAGEESDIRSTVFGADPLGQDLVSVFHTVGMGIG